MGPEYSGNSKEDGHWIESGTSATGEQWWEKMYLQSAVELPRELQWVPDPLSYNPRATIRPHMGGRLRREAEEYELEFFEIGYGAELQRLTRIPDAPTVDQMYWHLFWAPVRADWTMRRAVSVTEQVTLVRWSLCSSQGEERC